MGELLIGGFMRQGRCLFRILGLFGLTICVMCYSATALAQSSQWGAPISEQQVYENPDDHDLNLRYAKQQIQRGEMLNAGAALERMLYANPNWHSARLLYAAVLYRLDDQKAALRELSLLEGKELNMDQQETHTRYEKAFSIPPKPVFGRSVSGSSSASSANYSNNYAPNTSDPVSARVSLALRADDNAGNALTDEGFGFGNRGDVSAVLQGRIQATTPISSDGSVTFRAGLSGQMRRHETFSQADYDVIDARAGISAKRGSGRMSFDIDARRINVSGEKYLEQIGPRVTFSQPVSETVRATVSVSAYSQNYDPLSFAAGEDARDGVKTSFQVGILKKIKDSQRVTLAAGFETKSADLNAFAYKGPVAAFGFEHKFPNQVYLKTQLRARKLNYSGSLVSIISKRRDTRLSARQAIGTSLDQLIGVDGLDNIGVEFGINYNYRNSNIQTNDFDNLGADIRLITEF